MPLYGNNNGAQLNQANTFTQPQTAPAFIPGPSSAGGNGQVYKGAVTGLSIIGIAGTSYDLGVYSAAGTGLVENPTGTGNVVLARSGGSTTVSGALGVGGPLTFSSNAGFAAGQIYKSAAYGTTITAGSGTAYDFGLFNAPGVGLLDNPTGTANVVLARGGGVVTVSGTQASTVYNNGALVVAGGLGVGTLANFGAGIAVQNTPSLAPTIDNSGSALVGSAAALPSNFAVAPAAATYGLLLIADTQSTGQSAGYLCANGNAVLVFSTSSVWVASTSTPGTNTMSVNYDAGSTTIRVYNNYSTACRYKVTFIRLN
jgi:hypothetical protein